MIAIKSKTTRKIGTTIIQYIHHYIIYILNPLKCKNTTSISGYIHPYKTQDSVKCNSSFFFDQVSANQSAISKANNILIDIDSQTLSTNLICPLMIGPMYFHFFEYQTFKIPKISQIFSEMIPNSPMFLPKFLLYACYITSSKLHIPFNEFNIMFMSPF